MRLRWKILSGFLILAVMLAAAGLWSVRELTHAGASARALLDDNYRSIQAGKDMVEALERQDSGVLLLLLGRWQDGRAIIAEADSAFARQLAFARSNTTVPGEQACIDSLEARYAAYKSLWNRPIAETDREGNFDWYHGEVHVAFLAAKASAKALTDLNDQFMYQAASQLEARSRRSVMPGVIAAASALLFTALFNFFIHFYVVRPLTRIIAGVDAFRERGKAFDVHVETRDELYDLARSIEQLCLAFPPRAGAP